MIFLKLFFLIIFILNIIITIFLNIFIMLQNKLIKYKMPDETYDKFVKAVNAVMDFFSSVLSSKNK